MLSKKIKNKMNKLLNNIRNNMIKENKKNKRGMIRKSYIRRKRKMRWLLKIRHLNNQVVMKKKLKKNLYLQIIWNQLSQADTLLPFNQVVHQMMKKLKRYSKKKDLIKKSFV